jgi:2'-5' RNA ligase
MISNAGTAAGISLWLMPEAEPRDRLAALIARLAARLSTPAFAPHVTLLAAIAGAPPKDVLATARTLAADLRPFAVHFEGVEGRDEYFRCLFARAVVDAPLHAAHAAAARAFRRQPDPAFFPHLSLVYGALPAQDKRQLTLELAGSLVMSFAADRLHVWRTQGAVSDWRELGVFGLSG